MIALLLILLTGPAHAAEPTLRVEGDVVIVDVTVQAPLSAVRSLVQDPLEIARIDGGGTEITLVKDGACDELLYAVPSFVGRVEYVVSFCLDGDGSTATLLRSEQMASYRASWKATDTGAGVLIHYEILAVPALKVPRRVAISVTKRQVRRLFEKMVVELEG